MSKIKLQNKTCHCEPQSGEAISFFRDCFATTLLAMTISLVLSPVLARAEVVASYWQTSKSQHFIIYYQEAPGGFVDELIYKAEDYYNSIVDELGYRRFDFWSWDNRAKIYLYKNSEDFHADTKRSDWTGAVVTVNSRVMRTFVGQDHFFDSLLPHEMTHIIFREFIGMNISLPLWIDEGVASSQEKSALYARMQLARELVSKEEYIPLDKLSEISNIDAKTISPQVFYSQAASLVIFLIREEGKGSFLEFSRALRDKIDWKSALLKTYNFASLEDLEKAWKEFMLKYK